MKKVLVVDDSATSRAILRACMPKNGEYELYDANDEASALKQVEEVSPQICVMDYNMPDKTGTEIAESILNTGFATTFVLMTANMQQGVVDRAKSIGFVAFVEKPVTPEKVSQVLEGLDHDDD
ncbi:MAG: response regulator [Coxiellaceae bacterium]|nr:response regulator [Coxiellaceae bacterium]